MHIVVTGGTGFIGRRLIEQLLQRGERVTVLSRQAPHRVASRCGAVTVVRDIAALRAPVDAVINLAGEGVADRPWTAARKRVLRDSRIALTQNLVGHLLAQGCRPQVWINASAIGIYGNAGDTELTETSAPLPGGFARALCEQWEATAQTAQTLAARVCIARLGVVLGPGGFVARMKLPFKFGLGGRLGNGAQWLSWIHRDDAVAALLFLLDHPDLHGAFNLTAPQPVTNAFWTLEFARALRRPACMHLPAALLREGMGEFGNFLLESQRVFPERLQLAGFEFRYPHLRAALAASL